MGLSPCELERALKSCCAPKGVVLHVCDGKRALMKAEEVENYAYVIDDVRAGMVPVTFHIGLDQEVHRAFLIDHDTSMVECRFVVAKASGGCAVAEDFADVNGFHFVHEGVVCPPSFEEHSLLDWCVANAYAQGLKVHLPLHIKVVERSRVVRMQRLLCNPSTPKDGKATLQSVAEGGYGPCWDTSIFSEWEIAVKPHAGGADTMTFDLACLPQEVLARCLPEVREAYFAFDMRHKLQILSDLSALSGDSFCFSKPKGVWFAGGFCSMQEAVCKSFQELGLTAEDVLHLRFCTPGVELVLPPIQQSPHKESQHKLLEGVKTHDTTVSAKISDWELPGTSCRPRASVSVVLPRSLDPLELAVGAPTPNQLALDIAEKLAMAGLVTDIALINQLEKVMAGLGEKPPLRLQELIAGVSRTAYNKDASLLFGNVALADCATKVLQRATPSAESEAMRTAITDFADLTEQQVSCCVGGLELEHSVACGPAAVLPLTALGMDAAEDSVGQKGRVTVYTDLGEKFVFKVDECHFAAGVKLRMMAKTGVHAGSMKLQNAKGHLIVDGQQLQSQKAYLFYMLQDMDDPFSATLGINAKATLCKNQNLCSDVFTVTVAGASHVAFRSRIDQPRVLINEPPEYWCPETTAIVYWDPTFHMWGAEQLAFTKGDASTTGMVATLPHFSSLAMRTILRQGVALDFNQGFDPAFDFDFTTIRDEQPHQRGGVPYQRPCGWDRKAVRVLRRFDRGSNTWLATGNAAWPVAYHGTLNQHWADIMRGNFRLRPGPRQINSPTGRSIYLSKNPDTAQQYAMVGAPQRDANGRRFRYRIMFQARVRPGSWQEQRLPGGYRQVLNHDVWMFEAADDIRIYGMCFKAEYF